MADSDHKQSHLKEHRKDHRPFEGRRITSQLPCHQQQPKHKLKCDPSSKENSEVDTFRTLLSRKDRHKESQSKLDNFPLKKCHEQAREEKEKGKKESSKSRSRSKALSKSKSLRQIVKKSKSMVRLQPKREHHKEERKSESPQGHVKSTVSYERKPVSTGPVKCKSNYNSKTTREIMSEITTERDKSKSRHKFLKSFKKQKQDPIKKVASKFTKKKNQKQNVKVEGKARKVKKEKRVLISEEHSKMRRERDEWEMSLNDDEFLDPRAKDLKPKSKGKLNNIVDIPKRKQRLSLNANHPRKPSLKTKTQAELQSYRSQKKELQLWAVIKIQKVFRGYLTRKYIKQCFEHNAAIKIQKVWKGFMVRKRYLSLKKEKQREKFMKMSPLGIKNSDLKIFQHEDYLLQREEESRSNLKNSHFNQQWTSILEEILSEESVSQTIKKKIQLFLSSQQKSMNDFELLQGNRSPSARSSISSQVINNEIASQRHFIEMERIKKSKNHEQKDFIFLSPKEEQRRLKSPHGQFCSPQNRIGSISPARSSTELLVSNLKSIQKAHKDRLLSKANDEKEELNKMLIKNKLSPRTHEKKYKQVDQCLQIELQKFNESINQIVKNCMLYGEDAEEHLGDVTTTPKKELDKLPLPCDISPHHQPVRGEEMSLQLRQYYQTQKDPVLNVQIFQSFDTSYQFVEEYLISLIDFVRQYEGGAKVPEVIVLIHKHINRDVEIIMRNLKLMTQNSEEQSDQQSSFRLPMYKYFDQEEEIIESRVIEEFNAVFPKLRHTEMKIPSSLQEAFIKMIGDSMNEALNLLRPKVFPFAESKLSSLNVLKGLQRIPFEGESSEQEMQYQYICAQALNKIFYWNKLEWGKIIRYQEDSENINQVKQFLLKEEEEKINQIYSRDQWPIYEELIEIIGLLTEELFETVVFEEIASVWGVFLEWTDKTSRSGMQIFPPDSRTFFLP